LATPAPSLQAAEDAELAKRPDAAEKGASLQRALTAALEREKKSKEQEEKLRKELDDLRGRP